MDFSRQIVIGWIFIICLLISYNYINSSKINGFIKLIYRLFVYLLIFTQLYFTLANHNEEAHFSKGDDKLTNVNWWECYYFSVITQSTVGYGNMTPITTLAEIITAIQALGTILIVVDHTSSHFEI